MAATPATPSTAGAGTDTLNGDAGDDTLLNSEGADAFNGGAHTNRRRGRLFADDRGADPRDDRRQRQRRPQLPSDMRGRQRRHDGRKRHRRLVSRHSDRLDRWPTCSTARAATTRSRADPEAPARTARTGSSAAATQTRSPMAWLRTRSIAAKSSPSTSTGRPTTARPARATTSRRTSRMSLEARAPTRSPARPRRTTFAAAPAPRSTS